MNGHVPTDLPFSCLDTPRSNVPKKHEILTGGNQSSEMEAR